MLTTILLIILVLILIGSIPAWPYSRGWGYGPSGGLGLVVVRRYAGRHLGRYGDGHARRLG